MCLLCVWWEETCAPLWHYQGPRWDPSPDLITPDPALCQGIGLELLTRRLSLLLLVLFLLGRGGGVACMILYARCPPLPRESDEEAWLVSRLVSPLQQRWFAAMALGDINRFGPS